MMVSTLADLTITLDGLYVSKGSVDVERFKRWRFTRQWWLGFTRSNASNMQGPGRLIRIDRGSPSVWKSKGTLIDVGYEDVCYKWSIAHSGIGGAYGASSDI